MHDDDMTDATELHEVTRTLAEVERLERRADELEAKPRAGAPHPDELRELALDLMERLKERVLCDDDFDRP